MESFIYMAAVTWRVTVADLAMLCWDLCIMHLLWTLYPCRFECISTVLGFMNTSAPLKGLWLKVNELH